MDGEFLHYFGLFGDPGLWRLRSGQGGRARGPADPHGPPLASLPEPLPKPTLRALPSPLVPLDKPVTVRCQGPPGVDLYRLEKLRSGRYMNVASLNIPAMEHTSAGPYRCSYQNGSRWSLPSEQLELVATGIYDKPTLSAQPGPSVSLGADVTLQCRSKYGFDQYALYKKGDTGPYKSPERWDQANFPITTVTAAHSGTYQCYGFSSSNPYLWSAPSDPLELVVTGVSGTPSQSPTEAPSSTTRPSRDTTTFSGGPGSTTESSRDTTIFSKRPGSTTGLAHQDYTKGNLVRICLGAAILLLLAGILVEDWHSRKKFRLHWVPAVHRPLPPLPGAQKSQNGQDGGRPVGHFQGLPPSEPQDVAVSKRS
ncbi:PREDICTED: platelet glycoprotein VI [Myotis brandtii]|uniref:platelet glycoprotein VI n=1 Tax=Myotis brandtii TaxID=109478 RepID=UPI000704522B|nr:PREDICTED: platelet glycoprotein VI [Myotis brandtii]